MTYAFRLILADRTEMTLDLAELLAAAGCDDGTPCSSCGVAWIDFDRDAASLEAAIRSAIADVQKAGCSAAKVEIDLESPAAASQG
jgi:hypothetical protein